MSCKNLTEALNYIRENFPEEHREILLSSSRLAGFISDLLPGAKRERTVFKVIFGQGIQNKLAAATEKPPVEQQMLMTRYAGILVDMGLAREAAEDVLWTYAEALGFEARTQNSELRTQKAEPERQAMRDEASVKVGDIIPFGGYDWIVLDKKDGKALLISEKILELRPYNVVEKEITWENCTLRKYLNGEFYNSLGQAKTAIALTQNQNPDNPWFHTPGGNATTDKVFLLSLDEVHKHFKNYEDRVAKYNGEASWWWLRSPGNYSPAAYVWKGGGVDYDGDSVDYDEGGVRPALWLNLSSAPEKPRQAVKETAPKRQAMRAEASAKVGDIILFGGYDWRGLAVENNKALLISRDILEKRRFDGASSNRDPSNIWADSELHKYLNGEFFSGFSADDKSRVYHSSEGNVFLLSVDEARKYFKNDADRMAKYNGEATFWWLRSPGNYSFIATSVHAVGRVYADGLSVYDSGGVRPALWLNLSAAPEKPRQVIKETAPKRQAVRAETSAKIGDIIPFGGYDWRVLAVENNKALLISEKILEKRPYHVEVEAITWEECTIRKYLNGVFLNKLGEAKHAIAETRNNNPHNPWFYTEGGNATTDKIFLLSLDEVCRYFGDSTASLSKKRDIRKDFWINDKNDPARIAYYGNERASWLLRSPGGTQSYVAYILRDGGVYVSGSDAFSDKVGVRPALWLNLTD
ncbi:MAG: DUF6273 domain-containing protein [Oscillospiraceae bacterium]|nr:DUF6273 domain-containing protein [Oscillospiraceae bacterium]